MSSGAWRLWDDPAPRPGTLNMAIDQALLRRAGVDGERWLRLYRWRPHCLSFGRNEPACRRYDRARLAAAGLDVVRRPTGGRAVWHARELTYAVAMPVADVAGLRQAYLEIHGMILDALALLGVGASLAPDGRTPGLEAGACFARPVGGEVLVAGRKVVGSAQLREGGGLLQHGSILLEDDQSLVATLTRGPAPPDGSAPLVRLLGRSVPAAALARAVGSAAAARWGDSWSAPAECAELLAEAREYLPRFGSEEWTWRA